jgi:hypothetical protein
VSSEGAIDQQGIGSEVSTLENRRGVLYGMLVSNASPLERQKIAKELSAISEHISGLDEGQRRLQREIQERTADYNQILSRNEEEAQFEATRENVYRSVAIVGMLAALGLVLAAFLLPRLEPQLRAASFAVAPPQTAEIGASAQEYLEPRTIVPSPPGAEVLCKTPAEAVQEIFESTHERLRIEVQNLGVRAMVNLILGVLITVIATGVLLYLIAATPEDLSTLPKVLAHYIPRVTTVALMETFAYFFLGLYRSNLGEIKYYQNERTTIAAMEIAWTASQSLEINTSAAAVIAEIAKANRNATAYAPTADKSDDDANVLMVVKTLAKIAADSIKSSDK